MLTSVMRFPVALWIGMAFMSTLDVDTAGRSAPDMDGLGASSFLTDAALTAVSFDVDLCGMFLISLYRDCLGVQSAAVHAWQVDKSE